MSTITLPNIRVSSDLTVSVRLKDNGVAIDWSTLNNVKASIYSDAQRALAGRCDVSVDAEDPTVLVCQYAANKPQYVGVCRIVVSAKYMGETKTYDKPAFNFVRWTADQDGEQITIDDPDVDVEIDVADVSSSLLDEAIRAAFTAAEEAVDAKGQVLETEAEVEAAEALRVSAEESRVDAEEGRAEAEAARVDEEAVRVSAEDARVVAENARAAAEDLREGAEDDRAAAETARETAEAARVAAEALRVTAEGSRETAEAAREAQASADHTTAASDHTQAAADHTQAAADHTTAASDHTQAGADHTRAAADHVTAGEDHAQALDDHEVMAGYDTRLGNVEGEVSQLEAKVGDLTDLKTPGKTSVIDAINSLFGEAPNILNLNSLTQKWKDADLAWSVSDGVLNATNGNSSANKSVELYLPNLDSGKTYTIKMTANPSAKVLTNNIYFGNYNDRIALTKDEDDYSGTFQGGSGFWWMITIKPSGNVDFTGITLQENGAAVGIDNDLLKEIPATSLEEGVAEKIEKAVSVENLETNFVIPSNFDFDATKAVVTFGDGSVRIKNLTGVNVGLAVLVPVVVGAKYKVKFTSDSTSGLFGVTSIENTSFGVGSLFVIGENTSGEFTVPKGFGGVYINLTVHGNKTVNLSECVLVRTDKDFLPQDSYSEIPAIAIRRRYDAPCTKLMYCSTGEDIDFFTNGLIDSDTPDGDFTLRLVQPNFYAQDGALGSGFATRFRLKSTATNPKPSKDVAHIYDRFGYASPLHLFYIDTGAPTNPGTQKNILMLGDSLTSRNYLPTYFRKYLNDAGLTNWKMVGRVETNAYPSIATDVHYEANGGYAWPNYVDDPATLPAGFPNNYFWDADAGHISIQYYMDTYCGGVSPDIVLCNIGWNQFVNGNYSSMTMEEMKVKVKTFLDTLHSEYPNCKAVLTGIQRGRANSKDCNHRFYLDSQMKLARAYQDIAEDENYRGWVIYGNIAPYFDGSIGLQTEQRSISMFTDATEEYVLEEVHPNEMGYKIFAFALYLHFLYLANH